MPNLGPHNRQSLHMHGNTSWRHSTLHVHLDPTSSVHWNFDNQYDIRYLLAERQLFDQQHRKEH